MKIGIIGPCEIEIMPFINKISNKKLEEHVMLKFYSGVYEGVEVVAVSCGVCKVNAAIATQLLISKFQVTHIILTGVAGALNKQLEIGDVVVSNEVAYHDVSHEILTEYHPCMKDIYFKADAELLNLCKGILDSLKIKGDFYIGRIITGETFITHKEKEKLIQDFNALCVDMESASVAHTCYVNKIPFIIIRSISDKADENASETFGNNAERASLTAIKVVEGILKNIGEKKGTVKKN